MNDPLAPVTPRAEFRVFGQGLIDIVQQRIWDAGATLQKVRAMPAETYVISRHTDAANVKVRSGVLDIKLKTGETHEGYEIFKPIGKAAFPIPHAALASIFDDLHAATPPQQPTYTLDELRSLVHGHPDLTRMRVEKMRNGFTVNRVICEYARVLFNGALMETACCESEHYAELKPVIEALGIAGLPNTSYVKAAQRILGM